MQPPLNLRVHKSLLPTGFPKRGATTVCLEVKEELFWDNIPVGDHNELRSLVVSAAYEEDPSILGNVEWEALSHRSFDDLGNLPSLPHDKLRTMFSDFSYPYGRVVSLVEDGTSILLPNGIAAETRRNGYPGSGARVRCSKYSLRSGFPSRIGDPTHVRRENAV